MKKRIIFILIINLIILITLELAVRIYHFFKPYPEHFIFVESDTQLGYKLKPGYRSDLYCISSIGFRGGEFTERKKSTLDFSLYFFV